jgi:hypothetical protein
MFGGQPGQTFGGQPGQTARQQSNYRRRQQAGVDALIAIATPAEEPAVKEQEPHGEFSGDGAAPLTTNRNTKGS